MPATTPPTVPMTRSRPRVSTSPRLEVPANTTNAAITAQYQRDGEISSPPTMARLVATPTWTACRVESASPGLTASPSGSAALSPVAGPPVTVSPVTVSPVTASPVTAWPVAAWPVAAWPVAASPLPAVPIAVVAVDASGAARTSSAGAVGWCLRPSTSASANRATAKATRCPSSPSPSTRSTSGATRRCAASSSAGTRAGAVPVAVAAPSDRRAASSGQRSASGGLTGRHDEVAGRVRQPLGGQLGVDDVDLELALLVAAFQVLGDEQRGLVQPRSATPDRTPRMLRVLVLLVEQLGHHEDQRVHAGAERPHQALQGLLGLLGEEEAAHEPGRSDAEGRGEDEPGQGADLRAQELREEVRHHRGHADGEPARPEAADVHPADHDRDEDGVGEQPVGRQHRAERDGRRRGQHQQCGGDPDAARPRSR